MGQTAVELLLEQLTIADFEGQQIAIKQAIEMEKQQKQKTIEEVFEWLTKNNYVTDLKETLIDNFNKFKQL